MPQIVNASTHPDFDQIIFMYDSAAALVEDMPDGIINAAYKKVRRKAFGWSINSIVEDETIKYVGDTVFSKANNTSAGLTFTHTFEVINVLETSVSVSKSLEGSISYKGKKISGGFDAAIRKEIGEKTKEQVSETTKTNIYIPSKTKLSITIKGTALLNNGVTKYFFFGIPFKKGTWEYIDVVTEYYDYYEEKI
ncbi:MAG: hypothetical protein IKC22_03885 [Bacilli bacterium]|nr:hypothetical protein [Bacilli bacterium]